MNIRGRDWNGSAGTLLAGFAAQRVRVWGTLGRRSGKRLAFCTAFRRLAVLAAMLAILPATAMAQGWTYLYNSGSDMGVWSWNSTERFRYDYSHLQWWDTSGYGGWQELGSKEFSPMSDRTGGTGANFLGNGLWHDVGTGLSFMYLQGADSNRWKVNGNFRFSYNYNWGLWYDYYFGTNTWSLMGSGLSSDFVGDGDWHSIGTGRSYMYLQGGDSSRWKVNGNYRFAYLYNWGLWYDYYAGTNTWALLATGLSSAFLGDGSWHTVGTGLSYQYLQGGDSSRWKVDGNYRFSYSYAWGLWYDYYAGTNTWALLGSGLSSDFIGDGNWHGLGTIGGAVWQYQYAGNVGTWQQNIASVWTGRFKYDYTSGQWQDNRTDGWHLLGAEGVGCAFLGDGGSHPLGDGFAYTYLASGQTGRWYLDDTHYFQDAYTGTDGWSYSLDLGGNWSPWAQTTLAADVFGNGYMVGEDGLLYFPAKNASGWWDLYSWNGSQLDNISEGGFSFLRVEANIPGVGVYLIGEHPLDSHGQHEDLYFFDGASWSLVNYTPSVYFSRIWYATTLGGLNYFLARDNSDHLRYLYEAVGGDWTRVSSQGFDSLGCLAANDTDLFFQASDTATSTSDIYRVRKNGGTWTFENISKAGFAMNGAVGQVLNNDVYFWEWNTTETAAEVYRWDATALAWEQVTHENFITNEHVNWNAGGFVAVVGGALYFNAMTDVNPDPGITDGQWAFYRCDADGYGRISDYGFYAWQYAGKIAGVDYWTAAAGGGGDLFAWDGLSFTNVSNGNFGLVIFETEAGGALYFTAFCEADKTTDIYRFNGTWAKVVDTGDNPYNWITFPANLGSQELIWAVFTGWGVINGDLWSYNPDTGSFTLWTEAGWRDVRNYWGFPLTIAYCEGDYYFTGRLERPDGSDFVVRRWGDWEYLTGRQAL